MQIMNVRVCISCLVCCIRSILQRNKERADTAKRSTAKYKVGNEKKEGTKGSYVFPLLCFISSRFKLFVSITGSFNAGINLLPFTEHNLGEFYSDELASGSV